MNVAYTSTTLRPRLPRTQRKPVHITSRVKQPRGRAPVKLYDKTTGNVETLNFYRASDLNDPKYIGRIAEYSRWHMPQHTQSQGIKPSDFLTQKQIEAKRAQLQPDVTAHNNNLTRTMHEVVKAYKAGSQEEPEVLRQKVISVLRDESVPLLLDNLVALGVIDQLQDMGLSMNTDPLLMGFMVSSSILISEKFWFLFSRYLEKFEENPNTPLSYMLSYDCFRNSNLPLDATIHDGLYKVFNAMGAAAAGLAIYSLGVEIAPQAEPYVILAISNISFIVAAVIASQQEHLIDPVRTHLMDPQYNRWKNSKWGQMWKSANDYILGPVNTPANTNSLFSRFKRKVIGSAVIPAVNFYEGLIESALNVITNPEHKPSRQTLTLGAVGAASIGADPTMAIAVLGASALSAFGLAVKNS